MKTKIINILLPIFIIIQPFLCLYELNINPTFEIAGFQLSTIVRYLFIGIFGLILIFKTHLKNYRKWLIIYFVILLLYLIFHHINALNFNSIVPGINYSLIEELFYVMRYIIPLFLIYYIFNSELSDKAFRNTIVIFSLCITLNVIISNIFYISLTSYNNFTISYNMIDWFTKNISHITASSKGLFYSPSIITSLLIITPYQFYIYFKEGKLIYLTCLVFDMLALFMVGTRSCSFGFMIIAILMPIIYVVVSLLKKEKIEFSKVCPIILMIIISFVFFSKSPALSRIYLEKEVNDNTASITPTTPNVPQGPTETNPEPTPLTINDINLLPDRDQKEKLTKKYIEENIRILGFYEPFLYSYSYKYDWEFWLNLLVNEDVAHRSNNRYIEQKMLERVKEINNNSFYDSLVGLTYSRTTKVFNLERDFIYQYYSLGIIGIIVFIVPLLAIYLLNSLKILSKKHFNLKNISLCLGLGLIFCIAYNSGDILDNITVNIVIGFVLGYMVKNIHKESIAKNVETN